MRKPLFSLASRFSIFALCRALYSAAIHFAQVNRLKRLVTRVFCLFSCFFATIITTSLAKAPDLMLLESYRDQDIRGWVMSEKLDGVRGFWDGKQLISRQGNPFAVPATFLRDFPPFALDGEIYSARGEFEQISAITRSHTKTGWERLKLHVFDVPEAQGNLFARLKKLEIYLKSHPNAPIVIVKQIPVKDKAHLQRFFEQIQQAGGEGVVVRNPAAPYIHGRSAQILKLKAVADEECTVVAHHAGKGKFSGKLGAISCENQHGRFRIGSGFTLADRENPPPIGSQITYKFRGFTQQGKPRFATFWRKRNELPAGAGFSGK